MVDAVAQLLKQFGSPITLRRDGAEVEFRGFLQHSGSKSWQNMRGQYGVLGEVPGGQYVLILPAGIRAVPGDTVKVDVCQYTLRRIEQILYQDTVLYQWGLCVKKDGD